jgi:hypothetical protein
MSISSYTVLFFHCRHERIACQTLVLVEPLLQLDDFERIGGSHQNLTQQRVWV